MSTVTNVILSFSCLESDERLTEVNAWLDRFAHPGFFEHHPVAGTKALERPTYLGAFNYLHLVGEEGFIEHLRSLPWEYPKEVQLFVCRQDDDVYSEVFAPSLIIVLDPEAP